MYKELQTFEVDTFSFSSLFVWLVGWLVVVIGVLLLLLFCCCYLVVVFWVFLVTVIIVIRTKIKNL